MAAWSLKILNSRPSISITCATMWTSDTPPSCNATTLPSIETAHPTRENHRVKTISRRKFLAAGTMTGVAAGAASSPALGLIGFQPGPPAEVDLLITGCDIVTFDKVDRVVTDGAIAVQGNTIEWIGAANDAAGLYRAKQAINARGLI